jgi:hypothetical protein
VPNKPTIAAAVLARNESNNIGPCLEQLGWANEVLVLDSCSTNDTVARALAYTPHVHRRPFDDFAHQRNAALATYQKTVQTAFSEVADALARHATMDEQLAAAQKQQSAGADNYLLTEARWREGVDPFLNVLVAQRAYYTAQTELVQTKLTAGQSRVALYQSLGGDPLIANAPVCDVTYVSSASSAKLASQCSPM